MADVMGQWVVPEEGLEAGLHGRESQYHHHHYSATTNMTDGLPPPSNGSATHDGATTSVYLDNDEGEEGEWTISGANPGGKIQDLDTKLLDSDIGNVLNAFINAQDDEIKPHDHPNTSEERGHKEVNSSEEYDEEEEVIELEFERAIKKLDTHTMHCPKCNSQVTKVILRRKRKITPKQHKPLSLLGCLPCLSVFIPSGKYFNMFRLFGNDLKKTQLTPVLHENTSPAIVPSDNGNVVIQEKGDCFGLFRTFLNKFNSETIENPQPTSAVDVKHDSPTDPAYVNDSKPIEQVHTEGNQWQHSKGKDLVRRNTAYYAYAWLRLHAKRLGDRHSPQAVIQPLDDVRLDVRDDSDENALEAKLLSGQDSEIEEKQSAADSRLEEGYYRSRDDGGASLDQQITSPTRAQMIDPSNDQKYKHTEIVKSIVYGGLMELITSLSIVTSAAAADASTLNIIALGMANVFGGLFMIGPSLWYVKNDQSNEQDSKYQELLGRRENFPLQATFAILSFLLFGFIPPVTYGFSFRISDNKDLKILSAAAVALLSVILLAFGKAYVQNKPKLSVYVKTIMYYVAMACVVSGVSWMAGHLIKKFAEEFGLFGTTSPANLMTSVNPVLHLFDVQGVVEN